MLRLYKEGSHYKSGGMTSELYSKLSSMGFSPVHNRFKGFSEMLYDTKSANELLHMYKTQVSRDYLDRHRITENEYYTQIKRVLVKFMWVFNYSKKEEVKENDIQDAFRYLSQITNNELPYEEFEKALIKAKEKEIPMSILNFQGDNGRRPKASSRLNNPIIVAHTGDNKYIIIDGNHRYLQKKISGENKITGIILELPLLRKSKDGKRWIWWN